MRNFHPREILNGLYYIYLNYFVNHIPSWCIRKILYQLAGMNIGTGSRIMMTCVVLSPSNIKIGNNTVINEHCFIDGRGGLEIGDNCSISVYSMIITGSHDIKSNEFKYITFPVIIKNHVWLCARSIIISPSRIESYCVFSAGSVFSGVSQTRMVYKGNPAVIKKRRMLNSDYEQKWSPFFR